MSTPIYIAIAILVIILLVVLFLLKKLNNKINDIALKTDFFDQKLDSSNETILSAMNQQYTDILTPIKNLEKKICKEREIEIDDQLYKRAKEIVIESGKASASYVQRRLSIGYAMTARMLEMMEEEGLVGPANGSKPREILKK